jgi:hypothetical protein
MISVEAQIEADQLGFWLRRLPPLDCWGIYETLTDGLIQAKADRRGALAAGDRTRAGRQMLEIAELTALAAVAAEEIVRQREWCLDTGQLWPLGQR